MRLRRETCQLETALEILGKGGMGVAFKAEDPKLCRIVALKAMLPSLASNPTAKERFFREARAAATVKHDHIVCIHQVGEDRVPFLAMEFLQGESLENRLKRDVFLSTVEVLRIGREIAEGLGAAHDRGMIHRDIKPANIWLESCGNNSNQESGSQKTPPLATDDLSLPRSVKTLTRVKILDFGLARSGTEETHLTQTGMIVGTPAYMAPEQGRGELLDSRSDLWSLGVVLYRMCTGKLPFRGADTVSMLVAAATTIPDPPTKWNPKIPAGLSKLILQLLEKLPNDRPASARSVFATLQGIERDLPQEQRTEPYQSIPTPFSVRRVDELFFGKTWRRRLAFTFGFLLVCGAASVILWPPWNNQRSEPEVVDKKSKTGEVAQTKKAPSKYPRACVLVWLGGGPSQLDTFDPKPLAPENMVFKAIDTSVPGIQFCETLPNLAKQAHHLAVIRTVISRETEHSGGTYFMRTGRSPDDFLEYPSFACVLAKEIGRMELPKYIRIGGGLGKVSEKTPKRKLGIGPTFLGDEFGPLIVVNPVAPELAEYVTTEKGIPAAVRQKLRPALELQKEKAEVPVTKANYGPLGRSFQITNRLVHLGVPVVEIAVGGWDMHNDIVGSAQRTCPTLDQGLSALIEDLHATGRLQSTLLVLMGEFGRTPTLNEVKGRHHWTNGFSVVLGGGLIKGGQVIGKTSDDGTQIIERPVFLEELLATIYMALDIDPGQSNVGPKNARVRLVEPGTRPIAELLP